jgi:glycosyltransferase involved in cell wall biosynthesis
VTRSQPRSRTRVAFCIDSFDIGGTELNAVRTAESLDPLSFDLSVYHLQADGELRARYERLRVPMVHVSIRNLYSARTALAGWRTASMFRDRNINVVHTHDVYTNIFFAPWARTLTRCGVIASRRWSGSLPRPGLAYANAISYRFSHRVLANSPGVADVLVREGIPAGKIVEIPNFLDDGAFELSSIDERVRWLATHRLPSDAFVVGVVARLSPVKNQALLLEALRALPPDVYVVFIGDGPSRADLESKARELGVDSRVRFLGTVVGAGNLHRTFDVSVLCSNDEGFPNAIIEALAASRPVVATSVGGVVDVISDGVNGILIAPTDSKGLANALAQLKASAQLRNILGERGRELVKKRYSRAEVISRLGSLYESVGAHPWPAGSRHVA